AQELIGIGANSVESLILIIQTGGVSQTLQIESPLEFHTYEFQYQNGEYRILIDGIERMGPIASTFRPNALWLGHPFFGAGEVADWSDFTVDTLRVTAVESIPTL